MCVLSINGFYNMILYPIVLSSLTSHWVTDFTSLPPLQLLSNCLIGSDSTPEHVESQCDADTSLQCDAHVKVTQSPNLLNVSEKVMSSCEI